MSILRRKILIFAKTYPQPSKKYDETVCTGGVLENGSFVRLYPISFRYLPFDKQFKRYQWIEASISKDTVDGRNESYKVDQKSIRIISKPLSTEKCWAARREIILKKRARSLEHLKDCQAADGTSLGIVKPKVVTDFFVRPDKDTWSERQLLRRSQADFFKELKPLEKLPYKFTFQFECDDKRCHGHKLMISDWEIYALFKNCRQRSSSDQEALQKVRQKVFDELCSDKYDMHFYVGTIKMHPRSWIIVGLFYPPKNPMQTSLGLR